METKLSQNRVTKRPNESSDDQWPKKKVLLSRCKSLIVSDKEEEVYRFRVLLPNGASLGLKIVDPAGGKMPVVVFADKAKEEYARMRTTGSQKPRRRIDWESDDLCLIDSFERKMSEVIDFKNFEADKQHIIRLNDGSKEAKVYKNMWDLTPDVELLNELPQEYAYETALADLIDNSLQAVWSWSNKRRLVSVEISKDKICIFDNGPGMDASDENSIVKWGRMGASLHRSSRGQAIGGKPPYLRPCFGMFGYGGPVSSMHLGRRTLVSSKTKQSRKVYTLHLERDALLSSSGSEQPWRADGGLREPSEDEINESPDGSFTKIEIFELKMKSLHISQLQCRLKDTYFPYIQYDEASSKGRTIMPIEFQVNGVDLAEIEGGEVAITNLNSCNGPEFVLQLHFSSDQNTGASKSPGLKTSPEANVRLKCVYYPIVEGKESIERILEKLEEEGCGVSENFESFSRVSIRCLGRLLPDARWAWLPFMEPRQRKGDRAQLLKRCCLRVKCFLETDAGFYPTPSKTDLAHHHPYTNALRNFGNKSPEKEKEVHLEIHKDGQALTLAQMEKQYQEWILQMHDSYDEEIDCGEDEPVLIINPSNKKRLGISSDVVRVHKILRRKGTTWQSGQKIKVLKGACSGVHKNNIYAELEYILLEGIQGDAGGEARIICRPVGTSDEKGCLLANNDDGSPSIDIRESISLPINIINSGKCVVMETTEWISQLERVRQKNPSSVDILNSKHCKELDIEGALPFDDIVDAGYAHPNEVVAVVRPNSFNSASVSKNLLDQKYIARVDFDMTLEIKFTAEDKNLQESKHVQSARTSPSSRNGFHGLYIFQLKSNLFEKAGEYTFSFNLRESNCRNYVRSVQVKALSQVRKWGLLSDLKTAKCSVRVGSFFPQFSIACYDRYGNRTALKCVPKLMVKICSKKAVVMHLDKLNVHISSDKLALRVKDLQIESDDLDKIRPSYEANLVMYSEDESFNISIPCHVMPGPLQHVKAKPTDFMKQLLPGSVIEELVLELFDAYGNHVQRDSEILLNVDGFCFQDKAHRSRKANDSGCVDLSGLLKVSKGYGETVSLSVLSNKKVVFNEESHTEKREIRVASGIPENFSAGSLLENVVFEIVNSEGDPDETIDDDETHGCSHTLKLKSNSIDIDDSVRYSFHRGRCIVRAIPLPHKEGTFSFVAAYSRHPDLKMIIKVNVEQASEAVYESIQSQGSDAQVLLLQDSSNLKTPKAEHGYTHDQSPNGAIVLLQNSDTLNNITGNLVGSVMNDLQELEDEVRRYASSIGEHEKELEKLNAQKSAFEHELSKMEDDMDPPFNCDLGYLPEKEGMMDKIENKSDSAAALVCKIFKEQNNSNLSKDIVGVVALLASVQTNDLARILAEYLGEDQMLAVVCRSYKSASYLEKYDENGLVDPTCGLLALATEHGRSLNGRYNIICLENIRPYKGEFGSDPQKKLLICSPTLPSGKCTPGFLGYAVNMINIEAHHLQTRPAADKGLRETLFYMLFGELQVYETREYMKKAQANSCIHHGAVSLDGGIIRSNGIISLGYWEPNIHFLVVTSQSQCHSSRRNMHILKTMKAKRLILREKIDEIEKETEIYNKDKKKFNKRRDKYKRFFEDKAPLLQNLDLSRFHMGELSYIMDS